MSKKVKKKSNFYRKKKLPLEELGRVFLD